MPQICNQLLPSCCDPEKLNITLREDVYTHTKTSAEYSLPMMSTTERLSPHLGIWARSVVNSTLHKLFFSSICEQSLVNVQQISTSLIIIRRPAFEDRRVTIWIGESEKVIAPVKLVNLLGRHVTTPWQRLFEVISVITHQSRTSKSRNRP